MHPTLELSELDTKIGRLFMAGMPGPELDKYTESLIRDFCLGGVILFTRNIESPIQLAALCNHLQEKAIKYHGIPLFLAIDQEGGRVARLGNPFTQFPGNSAIGHGSRSEERAEQFALVTAREMSLVGLNMNLAPVLDVQRNKAERHLEGRMFSDDPDKVALLGRIVVRTLQENGVMAVAKHFPGLGKTSVDPHHDLPTIEVGPQEMEEVNLSPFMGAVAEGVSAIMTSHAIYPFLEPRLPATFSREILTVLLRQRLGFQGMVITDDLEMGAIKKWWGVVHGAVASFEAGADIILICQDQEIVMECMQKFRREVLQGNIPMGRVEQSVGRIMKAKSRFLGNWEKTSLEETSTYFAL